MEMYFKQVSSTEELPGPEVVRIYNPAFALMNVAKVIQVSNLYSEWIRYGYSVFYYVPDITTIFVYENRN